LESSYRFGGVAGEIVRRFAKFSTALVVLPAIILVFLLTLLAGLASWALHLPWWLTVLVSQLVMSPILGKSALAARDGDLDAGFLSNWDFGALAGFIGRYALLSLAWWIPVLVAARSLVSTLVSTVAMASMNPMALLSARGAMLVLGVVILVAIATIAPALTLLIATRAVSVPESFAAETWSWLLDRRGDMPAFFACTIGGVAVFAVLTIPPLLLVVALAFSIKLQLGVAAASLIYAMPAIGGTVLLGRLAGAFVSSDQDPQSEEAIDAPPESDVPQPATVKPAAPQPASVTLAQVIKQLAATEDAALPSAIAEAEALRTKNPAHAGLLGELSKLYLRAGRVPEAVDTASEALSRALSSGASGAALTCYVAFQTHRKNLKLKAVEFEELGRALLEQKKFGDAAWCFAATAKVGGEPIRVQKGIIATADAANKAGQLQEAARLYQYVLQNAPAAPHAEYCQRMLSAIQAKQKKAATG
jgi:hypothetical protein